GFAKMNIGTSLEDGPYDLLAERRKDMSCEDGELHHMLDRMLTSNEDEWKKAITLTLKALYQQFELENCDANVSQARPKQDPPRRHFLLCQRNIRIGRSRTGSTAGQSSSRR